MIRNAHGTIITGEPVRDDVRAFYVTVIDPSGKDYRLALGPFSTKVAAEARVDDVRRHVADKNYRDHVWFAYGTAGLADSPQGALPNGIFNEALDFEPYFLNAQKGVA